MDFFAGTFEDWFKSYAQKRLFRLWRKHDEENGELECEYVYFNQVINLDNDWLIGYSTFDERFPNNQYPSLDWVKLSEIDFAYFPTDEED